MFTVSYAEINDLAQNLWINGNVGLGYASPLSVQTVKIYFDDYHIKQTKTKANKTKIRDSRPLLKGGCFFPHDNISLEFVNSLQQGLK